MASFGLGNAVPEKGVWYHMIRIGQFSAALGAIGGLTAGIFAIVGLDLPPWGSMAHAKAIAHHADKLDTDLQSLIATEKADHRDLNESVLLTQRSTLVLELTMEIKAKDDIAADQTRGEIANIDRRLNAISPQP